jgi:8-amino-7-oxononanoate synthase
MRYVDNSSGESPFGFELTHGKFSVADFYNYNGSDDILEKTNLFSSMHESWNKKNIYQYERYRGPSKGKRIKLDYKRSNGNSDFLIFGSNDYLGLASHPEVVKSAKAALDIYGFGATGSGVSTGLSNEHLKLQEMLAGMFQKEKALLYNSGYGANVGILSSICRKGDVVLFDRLCHASIQDALLMASANGAKCFPFKHNNMKDLESLLQKYRDEFSGCLIVTEGIFSMDGDIADMSSIVKIAKRYNSRTFLDVAHDFGVIGENGLGAGEYHNVLSEIDIIMGTFSKIAGGIGGFCVSSASTIEYLRMMSRAFMFSVAIPPSTAAAVIAALELFWNDKSLINNLRSNIRYFVGELKKIGVEIDINHQSSICPVIIGDEYKLEVMAKILFDNGIFVTPVLFPAVSKTSCRFRFTVTALHTLTDLDYAILVLKTALERVKLININDENDFDFYRNAA